MVVSFGVGIVREAIIYILGGGCTSFGGSQKTVCHFIFEMFRFATGTFCAANKECQTTSFSYKLPLTIYYLVTMIADLETFITDTTATEAMELRDNLLLPPEPCCTPHCKNMSNAADNGGFAKLCSPCVASMRADLEAELGNDGAHATIGTNGIDSTVGTGRWFLRRMGGKNRSWILL
jgi:hypothetical protein